MILGHGLNQKVDEMRDMERKRYGIGRKEGNDVSRDPDRSEPVLREEDQVDARSTLAMFIAALIVAVPVILAGAAPMIFLFWLFTVGL